MNTDHLLSELQDLERQRIVALVTWLMSHGAKEPIAQILADPAAAFDFAESAEAGAEPFVHLRYRELVSWALTQMTRIQRACAPSQALVLIATTYGWEQLPALDVHIANELSIQYERHTKTLPNGCRSLYLSDGSALPIQEELS
jgi:hypothetical protein